MRIVSQTGKYDVLYEKVMVWTDLEGRICKPYGVVAYYRWLNMPFATYSTKEKTMNVVQMLRESYKDFMRLRNGLKTSYAVSFMFQFPKDEEIEV